MVIFIISPKSIPCPSITKLFGCCFNLIRFSGRETLEQQNHLLVVGVWEHINAGRFFQHKRSAAQRFRAWPTKVNPILQRCVRRTGNVHESIQAVCVPDGVLRWWLCGWGQKKRNQSQCMLKWESIDWKQKGFCLAYWGQLSADRWLRASFHFSPETSST